MARSERQRKKIIKRQWALVMAYVYANWRPGTTAFNSVVDKYEEAKEMLKSDLHFAVRKYPILLGSNVTYRNIPWRNPRPLPRSK